MRLRHAMLFLVALLMLQPVRSAGAQAEPIKTSYQYLAPDWITFTAEIETGQEIQTAIVFFQAESDPHTSVGLATVQKMDGGKYAFSYTHKLSDYFMRAFSTIDYRWEWVTADDVKHKSEPESFYYDDNRYEWTSIEGKNFRLHWYEGDIVFGVSVLNAAQKGFEKAQSYLPFPAPNMLDIYVYADSASLQAILGPHSAEWVAGHADPDIGVIVAALPPGPDQALLVQQRIPHELMHILLYRYMLNGYKNLPSWMNEGLASLVELYPNSDYQVLLKNAAETETLLPMSALCRPFPSDAATALLAYAQSASFTGYIHSEYGISGMEALAAAYANGLDCERGVQQALDRSLAQVERKWRSEVLAVDVNATAVNNLIPWLLLLGVALAPMLITAAWRALRRDRQHISSP